MNHIYIESNSDRNDLLEIGANKLSKRASLKEETKLKNRNLEWLAQQRLELLDELFRSLVETVRLQQNQSTKGEF